MIRSIQEFEDDNISEWYDCLHNYFRNHEDIISQYSNFDISNERCFDESACFYNSISLLLTVEQSQLQAELRIKVVGEIVKNRSLYVSGDF